MLGKLITIASFSQVIDTQLAKRKLESEGIECFIVDEHVFSIDWLYPNVVGDVKLQVNEANVGRAIEILQQTDSMEDVFSENDEPHCPNCNSSDVYYERFSQRLAFASWLLLIIPFPFLKRKWKCRKCGYHWKAK
jgi:hypothetical protein